MKSIFNNIIMTAAAGAAGLMLASCEVPSYTSTGSSTAFTDYTSVSVNKSVSLTTEAKAAAMNDSSFLRGFDASTLYDLEANGAVFYNESNQQEDMLSILKRNGVNTIRLRLWVDPYNAKATPSLENYGYNTLEKTAVIAKRAKALGLKFLLDFHYSDTWTHPGQQLCPAAWDGVSDLAATLGTYTTASLNYLKNNSALPDYVQIGNEIDSGMLLQTSSNGTFANGASVWTSGTPAAEDTEGRARLVNILNAAGSAIKNVSEDIEVIIHIADPRVYTATFKSILSSVTYYQAVGLSFYPCNSNRTLSGLTSAITEILGAGKKAYVLETSFPYTCEWVSGKNDSTNNNVGYTGTESVAVAYTNLTSSERTAYGITDTTKDNTSIVTADAANQAAVLRAVMATVAEAGGSGVFYWGGDWVSTTKVPSTWENQALFDLDGKVLPAAKIFGLTAASN